VLSALLGDHPLDAEADGQVQQDRGGAAAGPVLVLADDREPAPECRESG
jgi:hypothetical protein